MYYGNTVFHNNFFLYLCFLIYFKEKENCCLHTAEPKREMCQSYEHQHVTELTREDLVLTFLHETAAALGVFLFFE